MNEIPTPHWQPRSGHRRVLDAHCAACLRREMSVARGKGLTLATASTDRSARRPGHAAWDSTDVACPQGGLLVFRGRAGEWAVTAGENGMFWK